MYKKTTNGSIEDIQGYICNIPPVGYGINAVTGEVEKTDVVKRSTDKKNQFWEVTKLIKDWDSKRRQEVQRQKVDATYVDNDLENFRRQEWGRRLRGVWFFNNGEATYITGLHYFYLNWWQFQGKALDYREPDRKFFYVLEYCIQDPYSLGLIEVTKRKQGKTARAGCFLYEYISRTSNKHGGIQSKTNEDSREVFNKAIIAAWKKLPHFFRPIYDYTAGDPPKKELRFFKPAIKGKKALDIDTNAQELESWIDFKPANKESYDGPELHRYISDEAGKLKDVSIYERHEVVQFCSDVEGKYVGKQLYTTTVEEMESGGGEFKRLWDDSDPQKRNENGRTTTGLYRYFLPAYETMYFDKFGFPDIEKGKRFFLNERAGKQHDPHGLSSIIRKNPFTVSEAFRVDGDKCLYDSMKLNDRRDELGWMKDVVEQGNFEWVEKDKEVRWVKSQNGRWRLCRGFQFDEPEHRNNVVGREGRWKPGNAHRYCTAVDPYDHDSTQDNRRSNAASYVKKKHVPGKEDNAFNNAYICEYVARPSTAEMMYEDMIKQCFYFGAEILVENNKPGILKYFKTRGYEDFLIYLPGNKEAGIAASAPNTQVICELTEDYIYNFIERVYFIRLIDSWLEFDPKKTTKSDEAMAWGYTEIADKYKILSRNHGKIRDITEFFPSHKTNTA